MIGALIGLILLCIVLGALFWGGQQLIALVPMAEPFSTIVRVLLVLILVFIVVYAITVLLSYAGIHVPSLGATLR